MTHMQPSISARETAAYFAALAMEPRFAAPVIASSFGARFTRCASPVAARLSPRAFAQ
jgi:hypothetical protein